jgi:hypothetical protein
MTTRDYYLDDPTCDLSCRYCGRVLATMRALLEHYLAGH